jgi:hypothetical protein
MMIKVIGYENNNRIEVKGDNLPDEVQLDAHLKPVLDALLIDKPLWTFQLGGVHYRGSDTMRTIHIQKDGEVLGYVRRGYVGRKDKYLVGNERIDKQMQRRSYYSTADVSKAIAKIKKTFSSQTVFEIMAKAEQQASEAMYDTRQKKWYEHTHIRNHVDKAAVTFINGAGRQMFLEHVQVHDPKIAEQVVKGDEVYQEYLRMDEMSKSLQSSKALVITQKDSVYNVKSGDNIVRYTDAGLPEWIKPKLGMLKLVEDDQYITNCGFRVSDTTFVVMNEESKDE